MPKFILDTNLYIDASRNTEDAERLERFASLHAPRLYLSSVVAAELLSGARDASTLRALDEEIVAPFRRRGRVLTPGPAAWEAMGRALSELRRRDGLNLATAKKSFVFDLLLAAACRESGCTLVSRNTRDMTRIARVTGVDWLNDLPA